MGSAAADGAGADCAWGRSTQTASWRIVGVMLGSIVGKGDAATTGSRRASISRFRSEPRRARPRAAR